jgi:hypothetical protein
MDNTDVLFATPAASPKFKKVLDSLRQSLEEQPLTADERERLKESAAEWRYNKMLNGQRRQRQRQQLVPSPASDLSRALLGGRPMMSADYSDRGQGGFREMEQPRFPLVKIADVSMTKTSLYLIKNLIPQSGLVVVWALLNAERASGRSIC